MSPITTIDPPAAKPFTTSLWARAARALIVLAGLLGSTFVAWLGSGDALDLYEDNAYFVIVVGVLTPVLTQFFGNLAGKATAK